MNLQALAAMDDCEHATGKSLEEHRKARTPKEVICEAIHYGKACDDPSVDIAVDVINALRAAGYQIVQVVSQGNKPFP